MNTIIPKNNTGLDFFFTVNTCHGSLSPFNLFAVNENQLSFGTLIIYHGTESWYCSQICSGRFLSQTFTSSVSALGSSESVQRGKSTRAEESECV